MKLFLLTCYLSLLTFFNSCHKDEPIVTDPPVLRRPHLRMLLHGITSKIVSMCVSTALFLLLSCHRDNPIDGGKPPCGGIDPGIVPAPAYDSPIWHPSGKFIGFNHTPLIGISYPYGVGCWGEQHFNWDSTGFWLINSDGTNMQRIFPHTLQNPAWFPDGEWIAFVAGAQILKMRFTGATFDTSTVVQLTTEGRNFFPAWSPDGQWIAYDSNDQSPNGMNFIWIMKSDGTQKKRIVYESTEGEIRMPNWSPDNSHIVHQRYIGVGNPQIFTMNALGSNPVRLTYNSNSFDSHPRYSPDGRIIGFWSDGNVWVMDTSGTNLHQLTTQEVDVSFGLPFSWSPTGDKIVYTRYQSTDWTMKNGVLWLIDVNSKTETQFTFNP